MQAIIIYLAIINLFTFVLMAFDKKQALKHKSRVSEFSFMVLASIGGLLGIVLAMFTFRHKTIKKSFHLKLLFSLIIFSSGIYLFIKSNSTIG